MKNIDIKAINDFKRSDIINGFLNRVRVPSPYEDPSKRIIDLLDTLRDDLIVAIEYDYVDAMYRDEYYHYFATKINDYERNCAKISFFEAGTLEPDKDIDYTYCDKIKNGFLGFLVIRPLQACIGRNVISVNAKKSAYRGISICETEVETTSLGVRVAVNGFPHSSQDGEMIVCAETSIWSICEYYGNKYPIHKTILPSEILKALRSVTFERQIPSKGLDFRQVSSGLKSLGFSPKVYNMGNLKKVRGFFSSKESWELTDDEKELFTCYVESGFPLILCLYGKVVAHAVVCVGQCNDKDVKWKSSVVCDINDKVLKTLYWYNRSIDNLVLIDDNQPCYQKSNIYAPMSYNTDNDWEDVHVAQFIVPLPSKVYLEASQAIDFSKRLIEKVAPNESISRTFLASARTLRDHISTSKILSNEIKYEILSLMLPHFVWVTEFGSLEEFHEGKTSGLILLDATSSPKPKDFLLWADSSKGVCYCNQTHRYERIWKSQEFRLERYSRNLVSHN